MPLYPAARFDLRLVERAWRCGSMSTCAGSDPVDKRRPVRLPLFTRATGGDDGQIREAASSMARWSFTTVSNVRRAGR